MEGYRYNKELVDYYTSRGLWTPETLSDIYELNARGYPDKPAFIDSNKRVTWKQFKNMTDRLAIKLIELGLKKKDVIICQVHNCVENVAVKIAIEKAGFIFCFAAMNLREVELDHFLKATNASAVVTSRSYHGFDHFKQFDDLRTSGKYPNFKYIFTVGDDVPDGAISIEEIFSEPIEDKYPDNYLDDKKISAYHISHIASSTGSTGIPKLIQCCANNLRMHGWAYMRRWGISYTDSALITGVLWTGPVMPAILSLPQVGGTSVMLDTFSVDAALKMIEREKLTYVTGLPAHLIRMAQSSDLEKYDISSLRFVSFAGAPFPAGVAEEVEKKLGCPILCFYGVMDTHHVFTVDPDAGFEARVYTVGKVPPWDEIKIVDDDGNPVEKGEIGTLYWRGPTGTGGYWGDREKTEECWQELGLEGWFNTNDRAKLTEDNDVMLLGRKDDVIIRGGYTIYPLETENKLSPHPKINDIKVVAMPDPELGEKACAFVILKEGESLTFEEMISYLTKSKMAKFKFPERLEIVEEFPTVRDKVNKRALGGIIARKLVDEGKIEQEIVDIWLKKGKII